MYYASMCVYLYVACITCLLACTCNIHTHTHNAFTRKSLSALRAEWQHRKAGCLDQLLTSLNPSLLGCANSKERRIARKFLTSLSLSLFSILEKWCLCGNSAKDIETLTCWECSSFCFYQDSQKLRKNSDLWPLWFSTCSPVIFKEPHSPNNFTMHGYFLPFPVMMQKQWWVRCFHMNEGGGTRPCWRNWSLHWYTLAIEKKKKSSIT